LFVTDHFLGLYFNFSADLYEAEEIDDLLLYKPWWAANFDSLTDEEKEDLRKLPNREYIFNAAETRVVCLGQL